MGHDDAWIISAKRAARSSNWLDDGRDGLLSLPRKLCLAVIALVHYTTIRCVCTGELTATFLLSHAFYHRGDGMSPTNLGPSLLFEHRTRCLATIWTHHSHLLAAV